ncbi:MAG TPA: ferrous iron transport protein A [Dehalococcoidia bacterium]|nr:ferrous iron transport protein A [Dehalococcoidia bacterium]
MTVTKRLNLSQMYPGQSGRVVGVDGGVGLVGRLSALGIRPGRKITKLSSMLMRGPVTVQVGGTRLAVGFGMASRILVELEQ